MTAPVYRRPALAPKRAKRVSFRLTGRPLVTVPRRAAEEVAP